MERLRVSSPQYFVRPIANFEAFQAQVQGLVDTAADYKCRLIVFPEYFTLQFLTPGDLPHWVKSNRCWIKQPEIVIAWGNCSFARYQGSS